jgi:hypothetical protein
MLTFGSCFINKLNVKNAWYYGVSFASLHVNRVSKMYK